MFHEIFDDSMDTFLANFSLGSKLDLENVNDDKSSILKDILRNFFSLFLQVTDNGIDNEKPTTSTFYKEVPDYEDDSEPEVSDFVTRENFLIIFFFVVF